MPSSASAPGAGTGALVEAMEVSNTTAAMLLEVIVKTSTLENGPTMMGVSKSSTPSWNQPMCMAVPASVALQVTVKVALPGPKLMSPTTSIAPEESVSTGVTWGSMLCQSIVSPLAARVSPWKRQLLSPKPWVRAWVRGSAPAKGPKMRLGVGLWMSALGVAGGGLGKNQAEARDWPWPWEFIWDWKAWARGVHTHTLSDAAAHTNTTREDDGGMPCPFLYSGPVRGRGDCPRFRRGLQRKKGLLPRGK